MNLIVPVALALTRPPGGLAHVHPIGRLVTGAPESVLLHEGFQQVNRMPVTSLPVGIDPLRNLRKNMVG
jgi:hypothetical protein